MVINWGDVIQTTLATVGNSALLLGAAAWLIKSALSQALLVQTETFKARLKADADAEIEKLKNSLQTIAAEHQVRFAKLHEKRAEVLAELYRSTVDVYEDGRQLFSSDVHSHDFETRTKTSHSLNKKLLDLYIFIEKHQIYLPETTCILLNTFVEIMRKHVIMVGDFGSFEYPNEKTRKEKNLALREAYNAIDKSIPAVRSALKNEFRMMLGVEEHTVRVAN